MDMVTDKSSTIIGLAFNVKGGEGIVKLFHKRAITTSKILLHQAV